MKTSEFKKKFSFFSTDCSAPLGMQDGRITDSQITASSFYSKSYKPNCGRLHLNLLHFANCEGSWISSGTASAGEYLQVDLGKVYIISNVATQGRGYVDDRWVTKYYLTYSHDGVSWESYRYGSNVKVRMGHECNVMC